MTPSSAPKLDVKEYIMIQAVYMGHEELGPKDREAVRHIRSWLVRYGKAPSVRELMKALKYSSPRSAALVIKRLSAAGIVKRRRDRSLQLLRDLDEEASNSQTVAIPLVASVACGLPILATENIEAMVPVSKSLVRPTARYFLLRAKGDSMNLAGVEDGDLVLVREQAVAKNGDLVVALIDDEATIKEFHRRDDAVILKPKSRSRKHQPIILTENFRIQGAVVKTIKRFD